MTEHDIEKTSYFLSRYANACSHEIELFGYLMEHSKLSTKKLFDQAREDRQKIVRIPILSEKMSLAILNFARLVDREQNQGRPELEAYLEAAYSKKYPDSHNGLYFPESNNYSLSTSAPFGLIQINIDRLRHMNAFYLKHVHPHVEERMDVSTPELSQEQLMEWAKDFRQRDS